MLLLIFLLFVDPVLNIPEQAAISDSSSQQDSIHIVQKGETLYALSKQYEVSVENLKEWNKLTGTNINTDQSLVVYKVTEVNEENKKIDKIEFSQDSIHIVNSGEYASGIASQYNIDLKELISWNGLESPDKIYPGQKLKLYPPVIQNHILEIDSIRQEINPKQNLLSDSSKRELNNPILVNTDQNVQDEAKNLTTDFNPGGIKTVLNVLVLVVLIVIFIYNIHK